MEGQDEAADRPHREPVGVDACRVHAEVPARPAQRVERAAQRVVAHHAALAHRVHPQRRIVGLVVGEWIVERQHPLARGPGRIHALQNVALAPVEVDQQRVVRREAAAHHRAVEGRAGSVRHGGKDRRVAVAGPQRVDVGRHRVAHHDAALPHRPRHPELLGDRTRERVGARAHRGVVGVARGRRGHGVVARAGRERRDHEQALVGGERRRRGVRAIARDLPGDRRQPPVVPGRIADAPDQGRRGEIGGLLDWIGRAVDAIGPAQARRAGPGEEGLPVLMARGEVRKPGRRHTRADQSLCIDVGRGGVRGAGVHPRDDRAPRAVGDDARAHLASGGGAHRFAVGVPARRERARRADMLGVDVGAARARVLPGDVGAARGVGGDLDRELVAARRAQRHAVRAPPGRRGSVAREALRVDVPGPGAVILPRHDHAARAVTADHRLALIAGRRAHRGAVGAPPRRQGRVAADARGVDVVARAAMIEPRDHHPAGPVRRHRGRSLVPRLGAHEQPVRGPPGDARARPVEALEVDVADAGAPVLPGDEHAARVIAGKRGERLAGARGAHREPVRGPSGRDRPACQEAQCVDHARAAAPVLPGDERATRAVGDQHGRILVAARGAEDDAAVGPARRRGTGGGDPLGHEVVMGQAAVVGPGQDRAARAVSDDRDRVLVAGLGGEAVAVGLPSGGNRPGAVDALGVDVGAISGPRVHPGRERAARAVGRQRGRDLGERGHGEAGPVRRPGGATDARESGEPQANERQGPPGTEATEGSGGASGANAHRSISAGCGTGPTTAKKPR